MLEFFRSPKFSLGAGIFSLIVYCVGYKGDGAGGWTFGVLLAGTIAAMLTSSIHAMASHLFFRPVGVGRDDLLLAIRYVGAAASGYVAVFWVVATMLSIRADATVALIVLRETPVGALLGQHSHVPQLRLAAIPATASTLVFLGGAIALGLRLLVEGSRAGLSRRKGSSRGKTQQQNSGPVDVFISYSHRDRAAVLQLAAAFECAGWTLWCDTSLTAGEDFIFEINAQLTHAKCVVVVWSRHSTASRWVRAEALFAHERNLLVTCRIETIPIPVPFNGLHTISLALGPEGKLSSESVNSLEDAVLRQLNMRCG